MHQNRHLAKSPLINREAYMSLTTSQQLAEYKIVVQQSHQEKCQTIVESSWFPRIRVRVTKDSRCEVPTGAVTARVLLHAWHHSITSSTFHADNLSKPTLIRPVQRVFPLDTTCSHFLEGCVLHSLSSEYWNFSLCWRTLNSINRKQCKRVFGL